MDVDERTFKENREQQWAHALNYNTVTLIDTSSNIRYIHLHISTQTLIKLRIYNNKIKTCGAEHLAHALRHNTVIFIHIIYI